MAMNGANLQIVATIDVSRSDVVVWWTNVRPERTASMARNCGAWSLSKTDAASIDAVVSGKACLASPSARKYLEANDRAPKLFVDPGATLAGVLAEQLRLSTIHDTGNTRATAKELRWPSSPRPLNLATAQHPSAPKPVRKALAIANWLVELSEFWESIEQVRLSRPALRKHDGSDIRPLPLAFEAPRSPQESLPLSLDL
jgi:hypothetical protein